MTDLVPLASSLLTAETDDTLMKVRELIRADYDASRTICVDGWILSRTEARLCVLSLYVK
jgi:hypothetical protein